MSSSSTPRASSSKGEGQGKTKDSRKESPPRTSQELPQGASTSSAPPDPWQTSQRASAKDKGKGPKVSQPITSEAPLRLLAGSTSYDASVFADLPNDVQKALFEAEMLCFEAQRERAVASDTASTSKNSPERPRNPQESFHYLNIPASAITSDLALASALTSMPASAPASVPTSAPDTAPQISSNRPHKLREYRMDHQVQRLVGLLEHEETTLFMLLDEYRRISRDYSSLGTHGQSQGKEPTNSFTSQIPNLQVLLGHLFSQLCYFLAD